MDVIDAPDYAKPAPQLDAVGRPFWEGAARGELCIQRCAACGHRQHYPRALCAACGATPGWETASGRGRVHTFTIVRQQGAKAFRDELPYVVAIVELEEGVRMMGNVTGCPVEDVHIGMQVEAYALKTPDGVGVPFWRASSAG